MYCSIYFPIADFRGLLGIDNKLKSPIWPLPDQKKAFIRNFGSVKNRLLGGSEDWIGEDNFCDASGVFNYNNLIEINRSAPSHLRIEPVHKRFYSDGYLTNRFEISLKINCDNKKEPTAKRNLFDSLIKIATLPVKVYNSKYENLLLHSGRDLAKAYTLSTSIFHKRNLTDNLAVLEGEPIVIATYNISESISLPPLSKEINNTDGVRKILGEAKLYASKISNKGITCKVWIIGLPDSYYGGRTLDFRDIIRKLRINLSRIHIEKEIIRLTLNALKTDKIRVDYNSQESKKLEKFIKLQSEKILRKQRYNLPQADLLKFSLSNDQFVSGGINNSLKDEICFFQNKILQKNLNMIIGTKELGEQSIERAILLSKIFFSYARGGEREKIVDKLYSSLEADKEFNLIRDKENTSYKDSILSFMEKIGKGNLVVIALSNKYITSEYCMFELNELYKNSNHDFDELVKRIFPIRVEELTLNNPETLKEFFSFWIEKEKKYRELIDSIPADIGLAQHKEYRKIKAIKDNIGDLLNGLHYVNTLSPEILSKNNFEVIKNAIKQRTKGK